jgi:hypothetical protein
MTTTTGCIECGAPADRYSPADVDNDVPAGRRCWRHWLTDPADVKPSRIQAERYAERAAQEAAWAVCAYLAAA